jgi:tol-pal system protein YbgF
MPRFVLPILLILLAAPAAAQSAEEAAQMRLYIQQLEERVRQLTGENERLSHELAQLRGQLGQPAAGATDTGGGAMLAPPAIPPQAGVQPGMGAPLGAPPQDLGQMSVSPSDPLIAPDGAGAGAPIDLSVLAGGAPGAPYDPNAGMMAPVQPDFSNDTQTAGLPGTPAPTTALSGSPRDEYDLAYGYILTGDYDLAERSFKSWIASFPSDPQAADAEFWLGESHFQQREYRDAANAFLGVYQKTPDSPKGPDALLKLGMSLAALGEKSAACSTLTEVGRKYPQASPALMSRVNDEANRVGC